VSSVPSSAEGGGTAETIGGFLAVLAIFGAVVAVAQRPVAIGLPSLVVALFAAAMAGGRNRKLAAAAVAIAAAGWLVGMIVCVLTNRPLW
jgi:hypothetical protein